MDSLQQSLQDIQVQILNKRLESLTESIDRTGILMSKLSTYVSNADKPELLRERRRLYKEYQKIGATVPEDLRKRLQAYSDKEQAQLHEGEESKRRLRRQLKESPHEVIGPIIEVLQGLMYRIEKLESKK